MSSIKTQMADAGLRKAEGKLYSFALRKNPDSVEIEDENLVPAEYISYSPQIDKRAIGDALHDGKEVPGAKLITGRTHLVIR